jgi:hypothetical protein
MAIPAISAAAIVPRNIATTNGSVFRSCLRIVSSPIPGVFDTDSARFKSLPGVKNGDNKSAN